MAFRSATQPVQQMIYQWLSADPTLATLATVYDQVPQSTAYPYVEIGGLHESPDNTMGDQGRLLIADIFSWSQYPGFLELENILEELMRLLDEDTIPTIANLGWHIDWNLFQLNELVRLDGITRQLATRIQIACSKTALGE